MSERNDLQDLQDLHDLGYLYTYGQGRFGDGAHQQTTTGSATSWSMGGESPPKAGFPTMPSSTPSIAVTQWNSFDENANILLLPSQQYSGPATEPTEIFLPLDALGSPEETPLEQLNPTADSNFPSVDAVGLVDQDLDNAKLPECCHSDNDNTSVTGTSKKSSVSDNSSPFKEKDSHRFSDTSFPSSSSPSSASPSKLEWRLISLEDIDPQEDSDDEDVFSIGDSALTPSSTTETMDSIMDSVITEIESTEEEAAKKEMEEEEEEETIHRYQLADPDKRKEFLQQALKRELRSVIQIRREFSPLKVENQESPASSPASTTMGDEEDYMYRRKQRNKYHAKKSRQRTNAEREALRMENVRLESTHNYLEEKNEALISNYDTLASWLQEYRKITNTSLSIKDDLKQSEHTGVSTVRSEHTGMSTVRSEHTGMSTVRSEHTGISTVRSEHTRMPTVRSEHTSISTINNTLPSDTRQVEQKPPGLKFSQRKTPSLPALTLTPPTQSGSFKERSAPFSGHRVTGSSALKPSREGRNILIVVPPYPHPDSTALKTTRPVMRRFFSESSTLRTTRARYDRMDADRDDGSNSGNDGSPRVETRKAYSHYAKASSIDDGRHGDKRKSNHTEGMRGSGSGIEDNIETSTAVAETRYSGSVANFPQTSRKREKSPDIKSSSSAGFLKNLDFEEGNSSDAISDEKRSPWEVCTPPRRRRCVSEKSVVSDLMLPGLTNCLSPTTAMEMLSLNSPFFPEKQSF